MTDLAYQLSREIEINKIKQYCLDNYLELKKVLKKYGYTKRLCKKKIFENIEDEINNNVVIKFSTYDWVEIIFYHSFLYGYSQHNKSVHIAEFWAQRLTIAYIVISSVLLTLNDVDKVYLKLIFPHFIDCVAGAEEFNEFIYKHESLY